MIWLVGQNGMLGKELSKVLSDSGLEFLGTDIETDISDIAAVKSFILNKKFSHIINCAAYTAVDKAEDESEKATDINVFGVANLAFAATFLDAALIHISTDYVFGGEEDRPLCEKDAVNPVGVYGRTKLYGEYSIGFSPLRRFFIIRTAWLYGKGGKNFVSTMLNLMNSKDEIGVVADQWGSPTWTRDLAEFAVKIIKNGSDSYGIYHFSGEGKTNWYEFAEKIYELGKKTGQITSDCKINPLSTEQYPTKAKRPKYSYLSKEKAMKNFGISAAKWEDSLERYFSS